MEHLAEETRSLSEFKQNPAEVLERLGQSHCPIILTEDGKPKVVVQEAESYQQLLDSIEHHEALEALREGLADLEAGRLIPVDEAIRAIMASRGR